MLERIGPMACALVLLAATAAWAQNEIRGVVSYVDPVTRTVYFTDGRSVRLLPGSTVTVDGRPAVLEAVRPGTTFVMTPPGVLSTTVTTVTQQTQVPPPPPPPTAVVAVP